MRNVTCVDTQISIEWLYCSSLYCGLSLDGDAKLKRKIMTLYLKHWVNPTRTIFCQRHQPRQFFVWYFHLSNQHVQRPGKCSYSRNHAQVSEKKYDVIKTLWIRRNSIETWPREIMRMDLWWRSLLACYMQAHPRKQRYNDVFNYHAVSTRVSPIYMLCAWPANPGKPGFSRMTTAANSDGGTRVKSHISLMRCVHTACSQLFKVWNKLLLSCYTIDELL